MILKVLPISREDGITKVLEAWMRWVRNELLHFEPAPKGAEPLIHGIAKRLPFERSE